MGGFGGVEEEGAQGWLSCASKQGLCVQTERAGRAVERHGSAQLYINAAPRLLHQDELSRTTCCLQSGCHRRLAAEMNKTEQKCECSLLCASKLAQKLAVFFSFSLRFCRIISLSMII